jgi:RimJ/RimL family protein N-acetyltransferase
MSGVPRPTERLAFRPWRDDDLALARALFGDARVTALVGGPFDDAQVAARLASELATQREHGFAYWPIALRAGGDIGCCGLKPRPTPGELELGYYLMPAHWGGGLAAEAARGVVDYAFEVLGTRALFALHHPENLGSGRVLEKAGFAYSHHELYPPTGLLHRGYVLRNPSARPA